MPHRTIFAESVQKGRTNDFSFERYGGRRRRTEQENRESCSSESAPSVRLEPCPQGHGGTVGKRCAYFVDERYLASLGLISLPIGYRIPIAAIVPHNHEITDWGLDL